MTEGVIEEGTVGAAGHEAAPVAEPAAEPDASTSGMKPSTRKALVAIAVLATIMVIALFVIYVVEGRKYISTDNAQIDGDKISINAPNSGTLVDWSATEGSTIVKDRPVGRIRLQGGFVQPQQAIRAPGNGTVAVDHAVEGAFVAAGTPLAIAYDLAHVHVTARVDETDVDEVHAGQVVDISVDAFPHTDFTGKVTDVQGGAAGEFSAFPQSNTAGNYQKVTQVIPVTISIDDTKNLVLVPGMNVTVKIHKDG